MIPLYKVFMPEEIIHDINKVILSGKISYGNYSRAFEEKLRNYIGNKKLLTTSTSNYALQIAFDVLDLPLGSEVIASPLSCLASNQPVLTNKLKIKWADIDPYTGTLEPEDVLKKITPNTKAILHYHWCGYPGYINEINTIAKDYGLFVIEDATEAFGAYYDGEKIGNTNSDIVCFNFGPVRLPNTIEGGAISFRSDALFRKALLMRDYGIDRSKFREKNGEISLKCDIPIPGYGAMMNNISGFVGNLQMKYIDELLERQKRNGKILKNFFKNCNFIQTLDFRDEITPSYWVYYLLSKKKNNLFELLRKQGIYTSSVHIRNDYYSCFKTGFDGSLKGVSEFSQKGFAIPSGWWINEEQIKLIIKIIKNIK